MENAVITIIRRQNLVNITSGRVSMIPPITHIAFGTGGTDSSGNPIPPEEHQTALTAEVARYPIEPVEFPNPTTARYTAIIPEQDLPSVKINEAALVDSSGALAAIRTMYVKQKDEGVEFAFTFDDEF